MSDGFEEAESEVAFPISFHKMKKGKWICFSDFISHNEKGKVDLLFRFHFSECKGFEEAESGFAFPISFHTMKKGKRSCFSDSISHNEKGKVDFLFPNLYQKWAM
jgi:hypothetical protein